MTIEHICNFEIVGINHDQCKVCGTSRDWSPSAKPTVAPDTGAAASGVMGPVVTPEIVGRLTALATNADTSHELTCLLLDAATKIRALTAEVADAWRITAHWRERVQGPYEPDEARTPAHDVLKEAGDYLARYAAEIEASSRQEYGAGNLWDDEVDHEDFDRLIYLAQRLLLAAKMSSLIDGDAQRDAGNTGRESASQDVAHRDTREGLERSATELREQAEADAKRIFGGRSTTRDRGNEQGNA